MPTISLELRKDYISRMLFHPIVTRLFYYVAVACISVFIIAWVLLRQHLIRFIYPEWSVVFPYTKKVAVVGYYIHVPAGVIYFILGFFQFNASQRRKHPKLHRIAGILYVGMEAIGLLGLFILSASDDLEVNRYSFGHSRS
jgi:hypothetical protein